MVKQKKIALNPFDDKRCYIDKYISVPWGYNPAHKGHRNQLK